MPLPLMFREQENNSNIHASCSTMFQLQAYTHNSWCLVIMRPNRTPTSVINGIQLATWLLLHLLMCILICKAFN